MKSFALKCNIIILHFTGKGFIHKIVEHLHHMHISPE